MAKEIKIAEIPIYGTDYETFHQKWEHHIQRTVDEWVASGWERSDAEATYRRLVFPQSVWHYAQVIGFVTISISVTDVTFEIYAPVNERYHYKRRNKINIQCWHTNGLHFPLSFPIECTKINKEIATWLDMIRKDFLKNYYLDVSVFNTISNHLDYKSIVEELTTV